MTVWINSETKIPIGNPREIREGDTLLGHKKGEFKTEGDCDDINEFEYFYL